MKLIVNADDLGFSKGINYGILDAYRNGVVTSTTIMMNVPFTNHAIDLFKNEDIGIGVHMNATSGKALLDTHELITDEDGIFIREEQEYTDQFLSELELEFDAQIKLALEKGIKVTHLDSHHHLHMWNKEFFTIAKKLGKKYDLPVRCNREYSHMTEELQSEVRSTQAFSEDFYDKTVNVDFFLHILRSNLDAETLEVMVHPGFLCGHLINRDSYREMRMVENSILTSKLVKDFIRDNNIELIDFSKV